MHRTSVALRGAEAFGRASKLRLDPSRCVQCGACVAQCPTRALRLEPGSLLLVYRAERCCGCARCVLACPYGAATIGTIRGANRERW